MQSWNMGYATETNYEYGYFHILNPLELRFNFLTRGVRFPELGPDTAACELGFGNGISAILHGCASEVKWFGTDFNPSQVNYARHLIDSQSIEVKLSDDAFDQFASRPELPMFDYICLHGIWSWISPANQQTIVDFVARKLKVGGVLYVSYNCGPGFNSIEPIRNLMYKHMITFNRGTTHADSITASKEFVEKLLRIKPGYMGSNPELLKAAYDSKIGKRDNNYLAHEYLNSYWDITSFEKVSSDFERAKLTYVSAARLMENMDNVWLNEDERKLLTPLQKTPMYHETRNYLVNGQFRSDLYVKGVLELSEKQIEEELDKTCFIFIRDPENDYSRARSRHGAISLHTELLKEIIKMMTDRKVRSFVEILNELNKDRAEGEQVSRITLLECMIFFVGNEFINIAVNPDTISDEVKERCKRFNVGTIRSEQRRTSNYLASPVTGGGIYIDDLSKFCVSCMLDNPDVSNEQMADLLMEVLQSKNSPIDMKITEGADLTEIRKVALELVERFKSYDFPVYKTLLMF